MGVPILETALSVVVEALRLANTEASRKYISRKAELELAIQKEKAQGYNSDDAKIEALYQELSVICEAAKNELCLLQAKK